ncbi:hypothetical protein [Nitrosopumilus adriaticus]|uniref:hypothetical protein n=1 Tax=Nitrosopumilus adriaticus TaxID=1580092 RepID=UPI00064FCD14|nr:hypothetical protein [Nitrosopumilus adriaticus]
MFKIKFNQRILLLPLAITLFATLASSQGYSQSHESGLTWQLIYLSDKGCNVSEERKVKDMTEIVEKYFAIYKITNQKLDSECLFQGEFFDKTFSDVDLNIIVFDDRIGQDLFLKYGYNGMYAHFGSLRIDNHVIMATTPPQFSSAYDHTEFSWSISEKLSQFILSYHGYNSESIVRILDFKSDYDICVKRIVADEKCNSMVAEIHSDVTGDDHSVLAPIPEIFNQKSIKYLPEDLYSSHVVKEVLRKITNWWVNGIIDDQMYLDSIKEIVDVPIKNNKQINTIELEIPNGFSILSFSNKKMQKDFNESQVITAENKIHSVLEYVPFNTDSLSPDSESTEIPIWFKNRATLWEQEKIGDRIFFDGMTALIQNGAIRD